MMNNFIEEILAEMPDPVPKGQQFIDLDDQAPPSVQLPEAETAEWVEILNDAKAGFEVDGATAVFSTWRVEAEDPFHLILATLKLLMVLMPELADWPWTLA